MKISFILYVFQVFGKNQYLTSHGIMYVFDDFLNFLNLTFIGIMYVFADFREKIFFTYAEFLLTILRCFTRTVQTFERLFWIIRLF